MEGGRKPHRSATCFTSPSPATRGLLLSCCSFTTFGVTGFFVLLRSTTRTESLLVALLHIPSVIRVGQSIGITELVKAYWVATALKRSALGNNALSLDGGSAPTALSNPTKVFRLVALNVSTGINNLWFDFY